MLDSTTLTLQLTEMMKRQLVELAVATGRSESALVFDALKSFLEIENWHIAEIKSALSEADAGDFASDSEVQDVFSKWS